MDEVWRVIGTVFLVLGILWVSRIVVWILR